MQSPLTDIRIGVIIPAAGTGQRFGGNMPKQFLNLLGASILVRTLRTALAVRGVHAVVLAVGPDWMSFTAQHVAEAGIVDSRLVIVPGSHERYATVAAALQCPALDSTDVILVHDAVRPLTSEDLWLSVASTAMEYGAAVPSLPMSDSVKRVGADGVSGGNIDRATIARVQTPQGFKTPILRTSYERLSASTGPTDCSSVVEDAGFSVRLIPGSETNIKITTPYDVQLAEWLLAR